VNGNGKGSKMTEMFETKLSDLESNNLDDYFLDNVTGDLFNYNYENK